MSDESYRQTTLDDHEDRLRAIEGQLGQIANRVDQIYMSVRVLAWIGKGALAILSALAVVWNVLQSRK